MIGDLVSVIIPAYRAEKYIGEALESVQKQTYRSWELIVVEDGIKDSTEELVRKFALGVPEHRVTFLRHPRNLGLGATRNTGIGAAHGTYLAFLDHDDIWQESHLVESVRKLESASAHLVYSSVEMIDHATKKVLRSWGPTRRELQDFPASLFVQNFITPSSVVLRSDIVNEVGLFDVDPRLHFVEDMDYWLRVARSGFKIVHLDGRHCSYRRGDSSAASTNDVMIYERVLFVMRKHQSWDRLSRAVRKRAFGMCYQKLGHATWKVSPQRAIVFLWLAWRERPLRVTLDELRFVWGRLAVRIEHMVSWARPAQRWLRRRLTRRG